MVMRSECFGARWRSTCRGASRACDVHFRGTNAALPKKGKTEQLSQLYKVHNFFPQFEQKQVLKGTELRHFF